MPLRFAVFALKEFGFLLITFGHLACHRSLPLSYISVLFVNIIYQKEDILIFQVATFNHLVLDSYLLIRFALIMMQRLAHIVNLLDNIIYN
jgi:hypothetical protein